MVPYQEVNALVSRTGVAPRSQLEGELESLVWLIGMERASALLDGLDPVTPEVFLARAQEEAGEVALRYPFGMDHLWYACDAVGHVAAFVSFSRGPIPLVVLEHHDQDEQLHGYMLDLPDRGDARPDDPHVPAVSCAEARRGLYVYDWGHYGERGSRLDQYERDAVPLNPITVDEIPEPHAEMVRMVHFASLRFADHPRLDLEQLPPYAPAIPGYFD